MPSLTRLSPSRMFTTRRGSPAFRATADTATASVGPRMAPRHSAAANGIVGTTSAAVAPTANADTTTSPTASSRTGLDTLRMSR